MQSFLYLFILYVVVSSATFTNPIFKSQDPWITYVHGMYYYTQSGCKDADICVKESKTLTGLSKAPWINVWKAPTGKSNSHGVWAPEMHYIDGKWYIYYAADDGDNNNHRLFVLQSDSPTHGFVEASTGYPSGLLKDSTDHWAIDPDVFYASDNQLYITWSCTDYKNSTFPQRICLARMKDPVTIGSATAFLSTPTEYWETRTEPIQEGPVGYTRNGNTYITYSGSASWISDDYSVGILQYTGGNILDSTSWVKTGPILDHHGKVFGPGSVVFTPSVDGSEYWVLYHAIEKDNCEPNAYACRDIRMQQMFFDENGYPTLGYPIDPGVPLPSPSGEKNDEVRGTILVAEFSKAWGDAAQGSTTYGLIEGKWNASTSDTATSSTGGVWDQIFRPRNPNPANFVSHVELQLVTSGNTHPYPKYGFYCSYDDYDNHAELFIDNTNKVLASHATVNGVDQGWKNADLPSSFSALSWHSLDCQKNNSLFTFLLDGQIMFSRALNLNNGQTGLVVVDTEANFKNLQSTPYM